MRDVSTVTPPPGKVKLNFSLKPVTGDIVAKHAHVHYNGNASMALDYIVAEWNELRAAKDQGRIKVVNP